MDSLFQKAMNNPAVKKLRGLEQTRVARVAKRQEITKQRIVKTLEHLDTSVKTTFTDSLRAKADDLQERADDLRKAADELAALFDAPE